MPTMASMNSEAEIEKNGTPASPATALASSVLPVPGWPESSTPRGIRAPSCWYFSGFFRKSTISDSSSLASSMPATSVKFTRVSSPPSARRAFERPNWPSIPPPPACWAARRRKNTSSPMISSVGPNENRMVWNSERSWGGLALTVTSLSCSCLASWSVLANVGTSVSKCSAPLTFFL